MAIIHRGRDKGEPQSREIQRREPYRSWDPFHMMREMMQWDPFTAMGRSPGTQQPGTYMPDFEVKETSDAIIFRADLPGVKEEELDISLTGNRITVSGQRAEEDRKESDTYFTYERSYGSFSRSFTLPDGLDPDSAKADLRNGVLTLTVAKKPEVKPKKISLGGEKKQIKA